MGWSGPARVEHGSPGGRWRVPRALAVVGAALVLSTGALVLGAPGAPGAGAAAGATAPATQPAASHPARAVTPVNLQAAYLADLAHVRTGRPYGVVPPRPQASGPTVPSPAGPATTTGTGPLMTWHGGPVQPSPHLYLLLWGPAWTTTATQKAAESYLATFLGGLGTQGAVPDHWSTITDQYSGSNGHPQFSGSVYVQAFDTPTPPPHGANQNQLGAEALAFAQSHGLRTRTTDQVIVATQSGTCPTGFVCSPNPFYCAWHSDVGTTGNPSTMVPFTNLPYIPDGKGSCGQGFRASSTPTNEGFSIVEGHEYAETITDPEPISGWITTPTPTGGEIGDKCAWSDKTTALPFAGGTFVVQPLFSNAARTSAGNGCVLTASVKAGKPGAPAAPTATAGIGHAVVSWTPAPTHGSPITKYVVVSSGGQQCVWTSGPLTCTVRRLTDGTRYTFRVKAANALGFGPLSTPSAAVTPAGKPKKPAPPTATAGTGSATVAWTAAATEGSPITKYVVVSSGGQRCVWTSGPLTCTVRNLVKGTRYTFRVRAANAVGVGPLSTPSNAVVPS